MDFEERISLGETVMERVAATALGQSQASGEEHLVERLQAGEPAAFDHLVRERSGEIYGLLCRLTQDREEARDLTQETFLQAFRFITKFRGDADLRTWLYRIAINQARNQQRWWRRIFRDVTVSLEAISNTFYEPPLGLRLQDHMSANPEQMTLTRERDERLIAALGALHSSFREVVILRDIEGLSYEEIAGALEISVGTVKSRLSRGRAELRRRLEANGFVR